MDLWQHPLFWNGGTSDLTAKTKEKDRIFTIKLGLSHLQIVQEGDPNLNVTLEGYPKKL